MKAPFVKGLVHAALTVAALAEYKHSRTKSRVLLVGLAAGWHLQSALYHFLFEEEETMFGLQTAEAHEVPHRMPSPVDRTQTQFLKYHSARPEVYHQIVKFAREAKAAGFKTYSIWAVGNRVRWHYQFEKLTGEKFKIKNDYFSRYARLVMAQEPDLAGFFTTKACEREA